MIIERDPEIYLFTSKIEEIPFVLIPELPIEKILNNATILHFGLKYSESLKISEVKKYGLDPYEIERSMNLKHCYFVKVRALSQSMKE